MALLFISGGPPNGVLTLMVPSGGLRSNGWAL